MRRLETNIALGAALLGIALLGLAGASFLVALHWTSVTGYALLSGIALLIASIVLDPRWLTDLVADRRSWFAGTSTALTVGVIAALVLLNVVASRGSQAWDLSKGQYNTLAPQSINATRQLHSDLVITGFYQASEEQDRQPIARLIGLYQAQSGHVVAHWLDPAKSQTEVRQLGVHQSETLVLQYAGKTQTLTRGSQTEQDITSAIVSLESSRAPTVCWAAGEGERNLQSSDQFLGYSAAADELTKNNLRTQTTVVSTKAIPKSCDVVAVVGPTNALDPTAIKALQSYLASGGRLLVAADPWEPSVTASLNQVIGSYGLSFGSGLILDPQQSTANDPRVPVVVSYGQSPIAKNLDQVRSVFPDPTAITTTVSGAAVPLPVAMTTGQAVEAATQSDLQKQKFSSPRQLTLLATAELGGSHPSRVVAVGTSAIAENAVLNSAYAANLQLFTGSLQWLSGQDRLISLPPRPARAQSLALTDSEAYFNLFFTLLVMPLLVIACGLLVWWRRRQTAMEPA